MSVKQVVATGIGAALYAALSVISIPVPGISNTSFKIALIVLVFIGIYYGPISGFLAGFIGHALYDGLAYGSIWWSWVFVSAMIGLFIGFIYYDKSLNLTTGEFNKSTVIKTYIYALFGVIFGSAIAYIGDVFVIGEAPRKIVFQVIGADISNFIVLAVGIPIVFLIIKSRRKYKGLDEE